MNRAWFIKLLAAVCLCTLVVVPVVAYGAVGYLEITPTSGSAALYTTWSNACYVDSTSSAWTVVNPHSNKLGGNPVNWGDFNTSEWHWGVDTYQEPDFVVLLGTAGTWECYVLDKGITNNPFPTPWSVSTPHHNIVVN